MRAPGECRMRKSGLVLALAASVAVSGCVQTRQFADVQFTPPQGDYRLLVMRPDVTVNSLTTGGMAEPRAPPRCRRARFVPPDPPRRCARASGGTSRARRKGAGARAPQ